MNADNIIAQGIVIYTEMLGGFFPTTVTCSDPAFIGGLGSQQNGVLS